MTDTIDAPTRPSGRNYVGGAWIPASAGETYVKTNPMRPNETVGEFSSSSEADADAAVAAAAGAFAEWSALPMAKRAAYLNAAANVLDARVEQVAQDMTTEMGKPLRESRGEAGRAAQILRFAAGEAYRSVGESFEQAATGAQVATRRRPLGVVALITPWNFPLAIPIWKLAPALIYGNTLVLKLAYESPLTGLHIAEAFAEAELPAGVLNVLTGRGSVVGAALVRDPRVRAISFTGSVATGSSVRDEATKLGKRVQLELGGHNPADRDGGRRHRSRSRGVVRRRVLVGRPEVHGNTAYLCPGRGVRHVQGEAAGAHRARQGRRPFRSRRRGRADREREAIRRYPRGDRAWQERRRHGCSPAASRADDQAYLIAPTVFEGVGDKAFLSCEEVFGPVTSLYRFATLDEALERANESEFGLSAAIFTTGLAAATRFQNEAQAGLLHVNSQTAGADVHVPFGGIKSSGFGPHEQGRAAIEFYTETVTIYVDP